MIRWETTITTIYRVEPTSLKYIVGVRFVRGDRTPRDHSLGWEIQFLSTTPWVIVSYLSYFRFSVSVLDNSMGNSTALKNMIRV